MAKEALPMPDMDGAAVLSLHRMIANPIWNERMPTLNGASDRYQTQTTQKSL